ncbi:hypothetical protein HAL07_10060 [Helicobacter ailurogastricus]|uniref:Uncharacterized protein n=2 Tax=Helicobacter ailurogastricus TaxID=1578720 RepID=A0A0K2XZL8_9HELI|nr:hypothetical protein HAL07_10060 [Helicobacter ailurogastricus]
MIQEVLEDRKHMEEKEALQTKLKEYKKQIQVLKTTPPAPTQHTQSPEERTKTYSTLKEQLINAQDVESGETVLKEVLKDYTDLLALDKLNVVDSLYNKDGVKWSVCNKEFKVNRILLFLLLASHVFKAGEIRNEWQHEELCFKGRYGEFLMPLAALLGRRVCHLALEAKPKETHNFGKLVCYEDRRGFSADDLKRIGGLFVASTFKFRESLGNSSIYNGYSVGYFELDL